MFIFIFGIWIATALDTSICLFIYFQLNLLCLFDVVLPHIYLLA